ncbi:MAG: 30S ribosomal protein S15 [Candidatus Neomarinimicrobiota bacterium]|jgi:small subunit ribosomal protein S15
MTLTNVTKSDLVEKYGKTSQDTGAIAAQIALLTERIKDLGKHFSVNQKDHSSRRGLMKMVSRRKHLLEYLHKKNAAAYKELIEKLELRK